MAAHETWLSSVGVVAQPMGPVLSAGGAPMPEAHPGAISVPQVPSRKRKATLLPAGQGDIEREASSTMGDLANLLGGPGPAVPPPELTRHSTEFSGLRSIPGETLVTAEAISEAFSREVERDGLLVLDDADQETSRDNDGED